MLTRFTCSRLLLGRTFDSQEKVIRYFRVNDPCCRSGLKREYPMIFRILSAHTRQLKRTLRILLRSLGVAMYPTGWFGFAIYATLRQRDATVDLNDAIVQLLEVATEESGTLSERLRRSEKECFRFRRATTQGSVKSSLFSKNLR